MRTTCYLCEKTDDSDLIKWGRNEIGWYHRACMQEDVQRMQKILHKTK